MGVIGIIWEVQNLYKVFQNFLYSFKLKLYLILRLLMNPIVNYLFYLYFLLIFIYFIDIT